MWREFSELTIEEKEQINAYAEQFNEEKRVIANIYQSTNSFKEVEKRYIFNFFDFRTEHTPKYGEQVLCDLGEDNGYIVLEYISGLFVDRKNEKTYRPIFDVKRWCRMPKNVANDYQ